MQKSYAQLGQDLLASEFFRCYPARNNAFLDVGAFDGISFSNTRILFEQGWTGVCVEPVSKNFQKLERLYRGSNVITVQAAAADYEGELELNVATIPWATEWGSDVSSPTDEVKKRWPGYVWEKEKAPAMSVNKILEEYHVEEIDFVSVDVEGQEMAVLRGFDLKKYYPKLIIVEYSSLDERSELFSYLKQSGYFCWLDNRQDLFMVKGKHKDYWTIILKSILTGKQSLLNYLRTGFLSR